MKDQSKVIVAVIAGVAAGVALGMLLAPEKGTDSRKKIASLANELLDSAADFVKQVSNDSNASGTEDNPETTLGV